MAYLKAQSLKNDYESLIKSGDYTKALNRVEEGIKQNPNDYSLYLLQADASLYVYSYGKDTSDEILSNAYKSLSKWSEISPNTYDKNKFISLSHQLAIPVYRKAAIYMNSENFRKASEWFSMTINLKSWVQEKDDDLLYYSGLAANNSGDFNTMSVRFEELVKHNYSKTEVYELLGDYYYSKNLLNKASDIVELALKKGMPISNESRFLLLTIYEQQNDCNRFRENNLKYGWFNSGNVEIEKETALIYYKCQDTVASMQQYKQILQHIPTDTLCLVQLGLIYYNRGIHYLIEAKKMIAQSENNIEPYRKFKDLYINDIKNSVTYLEKALSLNVKSHIAIQCLYLSYKNLQRKEEMEKLKQKYGYIEE
jgi:tetratricopeptide (TPR) repeat protein